MKVTVNDCLQLDSFKNSIVVAGERKMDNRVKAVSVMDAATVEEAVKCSGEAGTMVLTAFAGMKYDVKLDEDYVTNLLSISSVVLTFSKFQFGQSQYTLHRFHIKIRSSGGLQSKQRLHRRTDTGQIQCINPVMISFFLHTHTS